jgi:hypothetical protein
MTLQTSGAISLSQVQSEYGGSNPISMSEYYRNGGSVPNSVTENVAAGSYTSYTYSRDSTDWRLAVTNSLVWAGSTIATLFQSSTTSMTSGGFDYQRGTLQESITSSGKIPVTTNHYSVRRRTSATTQTVNVNQNVPTSGTISMDDFYGGRSS